jgi:site-specific DNA recombinase
LRYRCERMFSTSLVHRLLTRETYIGRHWFSQIDAKAQTLKPREEWIEVRVPPILDEETFARVRASLTERSPAKTAPRLVNSPVLLTGLAQCATCHGGMQLRTGKSGRYRYYTCSTCARLGKSACKGRSVPMDLLDNLVLDHLARRLFTLERMQELLAEHTARSQTGAVDWRQKAKAADQELRQIEDGTRRLYEMVERGVAPADELLGNRLSELRQRREEVLRLKGMAERQRALPRRQIAPEQLEEFCAAMRGQLTGADIATRKAYLRLFVERIEVDDAEVRMSGPNAALEAGLRQKAGGGGVPTFIPEWRPLREGPPDGQQLQSSLISATS